MSSCLDISLDKYLCLFYSIIKILTVLTQHAPIFGVFDLLLQFLLKLLFLLLLFYSFFILLPFGTFLFSRGSCYIQSIHSPHKTLQPLWVILQDRPVRLLSFPPPNFKCFWEKNGVCWFYCLLSPECRWPIVREGNEPCPVTDHCSQGMVLNKLILCPSLWFVLSCSLLN